MHNAIIMCTCVYIGLLLLITRLDDRRVLYCTHDVVTDTLNDPSLYCQFSGKAIYSCYVTKAIPIIMMMDIRTSSYR